MKRRTSIRHYEPDSRVVMEMCWASMYSQNVEIAKKLGLRFCGMDLTVKMGSSWWLYALRDGRFFELSCQLREENFTVESAVVRALFWVNDKETTINHTIQYLTSSYPIVPGLFAMRRYGEGMLYAALPFAMRRYGEGMLYAALPLHMQRDCFRIRIHDQQVNKAQLYHCTRARPPIQYLTTQ
ncbi:hypothetical protein HKD37_18G051677 [Glycine soja]